MKKNFIVVCFLIGSFIINLISFVSLVDAVAVAGVYSDRKPLELSPGEEKEIIFTLQNRAGEGGEVKFRVSITQDYEIASFIDDEREYLVPFGATDVLVKILVRAPEVDVGEEYQVRVEFSPIVLNEGEGMVNIALGLSKSFIVKVVEEKEVLEKEIELGEEKGEISEDISLIWMIIGIVLIMIVAGIIWFVVSRKKREIVGNLESSTNPNYLAN